MNTPPIDVIVPVYRGLAETQRCIESVLRAPQQTAFELIAINDAGPEPALTAWLRKLAAEGKLTLLENDTNLGFVRTVNRGMALHAERDVILLNSDTEVANDWLDRLAACAARNPRAGTLTPFSNNATICSYPFEGWTGGVPGSLGLAGLDKLIASTLAGQVVEIPTGVGFCMYVRRSCLDEVGLFDAERFGRGYGEENDFCRRAAALGWANLLAADIFVFHEGGVSFSEERFSLQQKAMGILLERHPDYLEIVMAFIAQDPPSALRRKIDQARCAYSAREEAHVQAEHGRPEALAQSTSLNPAAIPVQLHISHGWGGGVERWVIDFCQTDQASRNLWLRSQSSRNAAGFRLELLEPAVSMTPLMSWDLALPIRATGIDHPEYRNILDTVISTAGIRAVFVSSLIGHTLDALDTSLPTIVILHDLYPFCAALFGHFAQNCTSCTADRLSDCLQHNPLNAFWHSTQTEDWLSIRHAFEARLANPALHLVAPSRSVQQRWAGLLPVLATRPWHHIEHGLNPTLFTERPRAKLPKEGRRLRIVVPGRLTPHKGLAILEAVLPQLQAHADVLLLGCGTSGRIFQGQDGIEIVDNYTHGELAEHLVRFQPDVALLLSTLPESFSYTLSEMFALGIPAIATASGAFAERIEDGVTGILVAPETDAISNAIGELAINQTNLDAMRAKILERPIRSTRDMVDAYLQLLPAATATPRPGSSTILDWLQQSAQNHALALQQITQLEHALAAEQTSKRTLTAQNRRLTEEVARLENALKAVFASHSWRITQPLRRATLFLRQQRLNSPTLPIASLDSSPAGYSAPPAIRESIQATERLEIRSKVRGWFHLPDRSKIILGFGPPAAALSFLEDAERLSAARNDLVVVLGGLGPDHPCWQPGQPLLENLIARRKLFFSPSLHDREAFLLAADALIQTTVEQLARDRDDILRAGLPILDPASTAGLTEAPWTN